MGADNPALSWIATDPDRSKVRLPGTDRARPAAATLELATRAAARVGVTRIADITRLDTIGIPTYQAVRPLSRTLAVSQGKGVTADLAKLSAVMESIETWHVEQPIEPAVVAAARELAALLWYDVTALPLAEPTVLHDGLPLPWTAARSLLDGAPTLVPVETVRLTLEQPVGWNPPAFLASTNGLASGNTRVEATLHALYEVIERDALTGAIRTGMGVKVDPASAGSPVADELCEQVRRAGVTLEVRFVQSPTDLPCFLAWLSCAEYPARMYGFGCHLSTEIALTRAITEAAQTRLAYIAGARDDLQDQIDEPAAKRPKDNEVPAADIATLAAAPVDHDSLVDDLDHVVKRATAAFGYPPLVVDLTREEVGVAVVKVIAPGGRVCREVL